MVKKKDLRRIYELMYDKLREKDGDFKRWIKKDKKSSYRGKDEDFFFENMIDILLQTHRGKG